MDLRHYYNKIRIAEAEIADDFPIVVSKAGNVLTEVTRQIAARMFVEGSADPASPEQTAAFRLNQATAMEAFKAAREEANFRVALMAEDVMQRLAPLPKSEKG